MSRDADRKRAARYVEARRAALGLTQDELAKRAGIDPKTIWNLECGERWPIVRTRSKLEAALEWNEGDLVLVAQGRFPASGPMAGDGPDSPTGAVLPSPVDEFTSRVREVIAGLQPHDQAVIAELLDTYEDAKRQNRRLLDRLATLSRSDGGDGPKE